MAGLSKRVQRLEGKRLDDHDPVVIILINFVDRCADGTLVTSAGLAKFIGWDIPDMYPEDRESDEAFKARADAALAAAKTGSTTALG